MPELTIARYMTAVGRRLMATPPRSDTAAERPETGRANERYSLIVASAGTRNPPDEVIPLNEDGSWICDPQPFNPDAHQQRVVAERIRGLGEMCRLCNTAFAEFFTRHGGAICSDCAFDVPWTELPSWWDAPGAVRPKEQQP